MKHFSGLLTYCLLALALTGPLKAWSLEGDHQHEHDNFPEGTLAAFEGKDAMTNEECFLFITDVADLENGTKKYQIQTSYSHAGEAPESLWVELLPANATRWLGATPSNSVRLVIDTSASDGTLASATNYTIKWLHGNHYHTNKCMGLAPHED